MLHYSAGPTFRPLAELSPYPMRPISLVFLANRDFYDDPVNDTWFNATSPVSELAAVNGNETLASTFYLNDSLGSVLGCVEQVQICNPNSGTPQKCTDLDSWHRWGGFLNYHCGEADTCKLKDIGLSNFQQKTAMLVLDAAISGSIQNVVGQLGSDSLLASNYITKQETYWSPALANNQWQIEAANWFAIGLAQLQRFFISNYRPPSEQILKDYWRSFPSNATSERLLCGSQKVQSLDYTTFSALGLGINFGLGGLLILAGYLVPVLVPRLRSKRANKRGAVAYASDCWRSDHALELQKKIGSRASANTIMQEMVVFDPTHRESSVARLLSGHANMGNSIGESYRTRSF